MKALCALIVILSCGLALAGNPTIVDTGFNGTILGCGTGETTTYLTAATGIGSFPPPDYFQVTVDNVQGSVTFAVQTTYIPEYSKQVYSLESGAAYVASLSNSISDFTVFTTLGSNSCDSIANGIALTISGTTFWNHAPNANLTQYPGSWGTFSYSKLWTTTSVGCSKIKSTATFSIAQLTSCLSRSGGHLVSLVETSSAITISGTFFVDDYMPADITVAATSPTYQLGVEEDPYQFTLTYANNALGVAQINQQGTGIINVQVEQAYINSTKSLYVVIGIVQATPVVSGNSLYGCVAPSASATSTTRASVITLVPVGGTAGTCSTQPTQTVQLYTYIVTAGSQANAYNAVSGSYNYTDVYTFSFDSYVSSSSGVTPSVSTANAFTLTFTITEQTPAASIAVATSGFASTAVNFYTGVGLSTTTVATSSLLPVTGPFVSGVQYCASLMLTDPNLAATCSGGYIMITNAIICSSATALNATAGVNCTNTGANAANLALFGTYSATGQTNPTFSMDTNFKDYYQPSLVTFTGPSISGSIAAGICFQARRSILPSGSMIPVSLPAGSAQYLQLSGFVQCAAITAGSKKRSIEITSISQVGKKRSQNVNITPTGQNSNSVNFTVVSYYPENENTQVVVVDNGGTSSSSPSNTFAISISALVISCALAFAALCAVIFMAVTKAWRHYREGKMSKSKETEEETGRGFSSGKAIAMRPSGNYSPLGQKSPTRTLNGQR